MIEAVRQEMEDEDFHWESAGYTRDEEQDGEDEEAACQDEEPPTDDEDAYEDFEVNFGADHEGDSDDEEPEEEDGKMKAVEPLEEKPPAQVKPPAQLPPAPSLESLASLVAPPPAPPRKGTDQSYDDEGRDLNDEEKLAAMLAKIAILELERLGIICASLMCHPYVHGISSKPYRLHYELMEVALPGNQLPVEARSERIWLAV